MMNQRILAVRRKVFSQFKPLLLRETRADPHMLQRAPGVEKAEQQRPHHRFFALLMPPETGDYTIAVALMFHLQHDALIRFVSAGALLGHDAVEPRALEAMEPV